MSLSTVKRTEIAIKRETEAEDHFRAYRAIQESRKLAPCLRIEATLIQKPKTPTLKEIQPYKNAQVLYEYRVEKVSGGGPPAKRIRVAHWVILNGETLPVAEAKMDQKVSLILEPFEDNPQLTSQYLSDSLPGNWRLNPYFDIGNPSITKRITSMPTVLSFKKRSILRQPEL